MNEPKPFASLTSGLLARKGAAKPAMRPQGFGQGFGLEDLGWNDMGHGQREPAAVHPIAREDVAEHVPSSIAALTPSPKPETDAPSPVIEQQRALEETFADRPVAEPPAPVAEPEAPAALVELPPRTRQQGGAKAKAAFTLRLDSDRHLKLRLACAVTHRSAQQIVTLALDDFLNTLPELESMADQVPAKLSKHS
jgi:hypothetical protein